MTIHNLYIFDPSGQLIYYAEWNRTKLSGMSVEEESKLMFGMIYSIKSFVAKISPTDCKDGFLNYKTSTYKLNFYETPSGLKFILNTDINANNVRDILQTLYAKVYVEYIVKNSECELGQQITSEIFKEQLEQYIRSLDLFVT